MPGALCVRKVGVTDLGVVSIPVSLTSASTATLGVAFVGSTPDRCDHK